MLDLEIQFSLINATSFDPINYEENLTLQEIADLENVSKSYVGNIINKTSKRLDNFENILGLYQKYSLLESALEEKSLENIKKVIKEILN